MSRRPFPLSGSGLILVRAIVAIGVLAHMTSCGDGNRAAENTTTPRGDTGSLRFNVKWEPLPAITSDGAKALSVRPMASDIYVCRDRGITDVTMKVIYPVGDNVQQTFPCESPDHTASMSVPVGNNLMLEMRGTGTGAGVLWIGTSTPFNLGVGENKVVDVTMKYEGGDTTPPSVLPPTVPDSNATGVAVNAGISVTFSEPMNPSTIDNTIAFTVKTGSTAVPGTVSYSGTTATFLPTGNLVFSTSYTATVTTGVKDLAGNALASNYVWNFTTGTAPDTTPPTVSPNSPANGATDVLVNAPISVTFSEPMSPSTINPTTFTVQAGSTAVPGTVSYSGTTATFLPTGNLEYSTLYTVTVTTGAKDAAGNALSTPYVGNFTTHVKSWSPPVLIETDNAGDAEGPQVAMDGSGNAVAVWDQSDGSQYRIWVNRYVPSTGWGVAIPIVTDNMGVSYLAGNASLPQVAMNGSGNAIAVWYQYDGTQTFILASRYLPGAGWLFPQQIRTNTGIYDFPQVAIDGGDNAIVVWAEYNGTRSDIWAHRYNSGTGWGGATLIETDDAGIAYGPQVAMDGSGNAIVVWAQSDGIRYNIMANRFTPSGGWGTATLIENDIAGSAFNPQVSINDSGNALAVWAQSDGIRTNIMANRYTTSGSSPGWGTATLIENNDAEGARNAQVAMNDSGNAVAVWQHTGVYNNNIWANHYVPGTGWGTATLIKTGAEMSDSRTQIAVDGSGNAIAVGNDDDWYAERGNIWANYYVPGTGWGTATLIKTEPGSSDPQVAMDGSGNAIAVWRGSDGLRSSIWAARFE